jgi:hypothetical protein
LEDVSDDMPLKPYSHAKDKPVVVRFEHDEDQPDNKWITLAGGQW